MKKALVYVLAALIGVAVLVVAVVGWVAVADLPTYEPAKIDLVVKSTPERVARGRKLASVLCTQCHLDPVSRQLTGRRMVDAPAEFGPIFSANITQDSEYGIGSYSDGELAYLMRTGVTPDGRYIPLYMVKLPYLADEDLFSVIAFLRSDDPLVRPAAVAPPGQTQPSFLTKVLSRTVFKPLPYPTEPLVAPPSSDSVAHGKYLVTAALDCFGCHSADFKTVNIMDPEQTVGFLGGGNPLLDLHGGVVYSSNLTHDEETGIGRWSRDDFIHVMKTGIRPGGRPLLYPMMPMPALTRDEAGAMWDYLATVPRLRHKIPHNAPPSLVTKDEGRQLYYDYGCSSCHGDDGVGVADLRRANESYPDDDDLEAWIRNAPSFSPDTRMPAWDGVIDDADYAPLIAFVRGLGRSPKRAASAPTPEPAAP